MGIEFYFTIYLPTLIGRPFPKSLCLLKGKGRVRSRSRRLHEALAHIGPPHSLSGQRPGRFQPHQRQPLGRGHRGLESRTGRGLERIPRSSPFFPSSGGDEGAESFRSYASFGILRSSRRRRRSSSVRKRSVIEGSGRSFFPGSDSISESKYRVGRLSAPNSNPSE